MMNIDVPNQSRVCAKLCIESLSQESLLIDIKVTSLVTIDPLYSTVCMLDSNFESNFQMYLEYQETLVYRHLCQIGIH